MRGLGFRVKTPIKKASEKHTSLCLVYLFRFLNQLRVVDGLANLARVRAPVETIAAFSD